MQYRILFLLVLVATLLSACNLGNNPPPTQAPSPTEDTSAASPPVVTILSPNSGDEFVVGSEILVSANATDGVGVTRMQLFANDQIVKNQPSQSVSGDRNMSAVLDYSPPAAGSITLKVIAYRGSVASEPAQVTVSVRSQQSQVTATPDSSNSGVPVIPNDGVCRALVNTGLNLRGGPSTNFDVITVLPGGTLARIIQRVGDNSWWKLRLDSGVEGWVSSAFTTEYGNCLSIPVATSVPTITPTLTPTFQPTNTPNPTNTPVPGKPDLVVTSVSGDKSLHIPAGQTSVTRQYVITITNTGTGASGQFESELTFEGTTVDLAVVSNLGAGESIALTVSLTFDGPGTYNIRVDVDPDDKVDEVSEANNFGFINPPVNVVQD